MVKALQVELVAPLPYLVVRVVERVELVDDQGKTWRVAALLGGVGARVILGPVHPDGTDGPPGYELPVPLVERFDPAVGARVRATLAEQGCPVPPG